MDQIKTFSVTKKEDQETFKRFDLTRGVLQMKRSEAILKALREFVANHPLDKVNLLDDFMGGKPEVTLPPFTINTDVKEIKRICAKMETDKLVVLKDKMKRLLNIIDLEVDNRLDR